MPLSYVFENTDRIVGIYGGKAKFSLFLHCQGLTCRLKPCVLLLFLLLGISSSEILVTGVYWVSRAFSY